MNITCEISKKLEADIVVVGGGTAGVFAAISAAKSGAKTILIEKNSIIGGTMTVANVNYPGLFWAWGKRIISGPGWESVERTIALGGAKIPEPCSDPRRHSSQQIRLNTFIYTTILYEMCEEAGVEILCNSMISTAFEMDDGLQLIITEKNGMCLIDTKIAIDTTGDANLSQIMGYKVVKSETQQPATLQNSISGYEMNEALDDIVKEKFENADLPEWITVEKLLEFLRNNKIDLHIPCVDADTSSGKTELEKRALKETMRVCKFLKSLPGMQNLKIDFFAAETGVRETNRIVGENVISADDYINGFFYPDSVCYAYYPIDLHVMSGIEKVYHEENVVSKIPYSALIPKGAKRILCAGRCISSDTYANSAVRVEAVCMATGQVAGCAAALAAKENVSVTEVEYSELCSALEKINAIIPSMD